MLINTLLTELSNYSDGKTPACERLYQASDEPDALIYGDTNQYNYGCSLYLIRKDVAKINRTLSETKPYWLADQFTAFHEPQNIAQARYLLGKIQAKNNKIKLKIHYLVSLYQSIMLNVTSNNVLNLS